MGKKTNIQYQSRSRGIPLERENIQLMKERQNTKDNHRDFDLQDRFINIDSTFNHAFPAT